MQKPYSYGGAITDAEVAYVIDNMLPKKRRGARRAPPLAVLAGLHQLLPNMLNHLVNKQRGIAFDSGEAGFSHTRIS